MSPIAMQPHGLTGIAMHGSHKIVSAEVTEDKVTIVRQYPSNMTYGNGKPAPDQIIKEVYTVKDGKIIKLQNIFGEHHPAHYVPESISFPV